MQIDYSFTKKDQIHYEINAAGRQWLNLLTVTMFTGPAFARIIPHDVHSHKQFILTAMLIACAFWVCVYFVYRTVLLQKQFPSFHSAEQRAASFDQDGLTVTTPESTNFIAWKSLKKIKRQAGALFLWPGMGSGQYIPASAFPDKNATEQIYRVILAYKNGNTQPLVVETAPEGVWPPPPQQR